MSFLGAKAKDPLDWFMDSLHKKVGYGIFTYFKRGHWFGNTPLRAKLPRLFSIFDQVDEFMGEVGR